MELGLPQRAVSQFVKVLLPNRKKYKELWGLSRTEDCDNGCFNSIICRITESLIKIQPI